MSVHESVELQIKLIYNYFVVNCHAEVIIRIKHVFTHTCTVKVPAGVLIIALHKFNHFNFNSAHTPTCIHFMLMHEHTLQHQFIPSLQKCTQKHKHFTRVATDDVQCVHSNEQ